MKQFLLSAVPAARRLAYAIVVAAFIAGAARADDAKPVRVGASHRVDVIAPGERVETAIDRMRRASLPPRELAPRAVDALAPRRPSERGASERPGSEHGAAARSGPENGTDRAVPPEPQKGVAPRATGTPGPSRR